MSRRHNTVQAPSNGVSRVLDIPRAERPAEIVSDQSPQAKAAELGWTKGQLLNVRNYGTAGFRVTLLGGEYDPNHPENALHFANGYDCQQFVSTWYAPEAGPRPFS